MESLPVHIARVLSERIVAGQIAGGTKLLQDAVAKEFGVSHVPVREAFRQLETRGLLISIPRQGVRVAELSVAGIAEINAMRGALEILALRNAIPNMKREQVARAKVAIQIGERAKDMPAWEDANREFHMALYDPCAMPRLLDAIRELHQARTRYMLATAAAIHWDPDSHREHAALLDAASRGGVDDACQLLQAHLDTAGEKLLHEMIQLNETSEPQV